MELLKTLGVAYITISTVCFTLFLIGLIRNLRKVLSDEQNGKKSTDVLSKMRLVYIEQVGNAVYMYDKLTNNFLLQATTKDELWTKAKEQYPNLKLFETTKEADFSKDTE
jgi:hypothetical protein